MRIASHCIALLLLTSASRPFVTPCYAATAVNVPTYTSPRSRRNFTFVRPQQTVRSRSQRLEERELSTLKSPSNFREADVRLYRSCCSMKVSGDADRARQRRRVSRRVTRCNVVMKRGPARSAACAPAWPCQRIRPRPAHHSGWKWPHRACRNKPRGPASCWSPTHRRPGQPRCRPATVIRRRHSRPEARSHRRSSCQAQLACGITSPRGRRSAPKVRPVSDRGGSLTPSCEVRFAHVLIDHALVQQSPPSLRHDSRGSISSVVRLFGVPAVRPSGFGPFMARP